MKVLALKPGHDGHIVYVDNGVLVFSIESEKDSGNRYAPVDGLSFAEVLQCLDAPPGSPVEPKSAHELWEIDR